MRTFIQRKKGGQRCAAGTKYSASINEPVVVAFGVQILDGRVSCKRHLQYNFGSLQALLSKEEYGGQG